MFMFIMLKLKSGNIWKFQKVFKVIKEKMEELALEIT